MKRNINSKFLKFYYMIVLNFLNITNVYIKDIWLLILLSKSPIYSNIYIRILNGLIVFYRKLINWIMNYHELILKKYKCTYFMMK